MREEGKKKEEGDIRVMIPGKNYESKLARHELK